MEYVEESTFIGDRTERQKYTSPALVKYTFQGYGLSSQSGYH